MDHRGTVPFDAAIGDLEAYLDALRLWPARAIEVERGEDPGTVLLMLRRAASVLGARVLTQWANASRLYWVLLR